MDSPVKNLERNTKHKKKNPQQLSKTAKDTEDGKMATYTVNIDYRPAADETICNGTTADTEICNMQTRSAIRKLPTIQLPYLQSRFGSMTHFSSAAL